MFPLSNIFKDLCVNDFFVLNIKSSSIDNSDSLSSLLSISIPNPAYNFSKNEPLFKYLLNFLWHLSSSIFPFKEHLDNCKGANCVIIYWRTCSGVSCASVTEFSLNGPFNDKRKADLS